MEAMGFLILGFAFVLYCIVLMVLSCIISTRERRLPSPRELLHWRKGFVGEKDVKSWYAIQDFAHVLVFLGLCCIWLSVSAGEFRFGINLIALLPEDPRTYFLLGGALSMVSYCIKVPGAVRAGQDVKEVKRVESLNYALLNERERALAKKIDSIIFLCVIAAIALFLYRLLRRFGILHF